MLWPTFLYYFPCCDTCFVPFSMLQYISRELTCCDTCSILKCMLPHMFHHRLHEVTHTPTSICMLWPIFAALYMLWHIFLDYQTCYDTCLPALDVVPALLSEPTTACCDTCFYLNMLRHMIGQILHAATHFFAQYSYHLASNVLWMHVMTQVVFHQTACCDTFFIWESTCCDTWKTHNCLLILA